MLAAGMIGCTYDKVEPEIPEIPGGGPGEDPISFATDIQPIFTAKCIGCHGGSNPQAGLVLTEGNAYNSINKAKYINLTDPPLSLIYTKPSPTGSHFKKYTTTEAATLLVWIQDGANDN